MVMLQVPVIPPTGNEKVDSIVQLSILGLSLGSVLIAGWQGKKKRVASKPVKRRHTPAPVPRNEVQKAVDSLTGNG